MPTDRITTLLRHSCYIDLDDIARKKFTEQAEKIKDWGELVKRAEANAISNLLYTHARICNIDIPGSELITFKALTARHQRNNRERTDALREILEKFNAEGIEAILLKGMALIHTLYSEQYQRPMGDIDILVRSQRADNAQQILRDLGYRAQDRNKGYLFDHHHLPIASKSRNGMSIQVEIHHNALSGDATSSMSFDDVYQNCLAIDVLDQKGYTLGHEDMLKHLCYHTFEPIERIKLGAIVDIYGYACKYHDQIGWDRLKQKSSIIVNTLRCLHFLTPLPTVLAGTLGAPMSDPPQGVGLGFPPLSSTMNSRATRKEKFRRLFDCSDWWRHIYYQVPPEANLTWVIWVRHPAKICFWVYRRLAAKLKSRVL